MLCSGPIEGGGSVRAFMMGFCARNGADLRSETFRLVARADLGRLHAQSPCSYTTDTSTWRLGIQAAWHAVMLRPRQPDDFGRFDFFVGSGIVARCIGVMRQSHLSRRGARRRRHARSQWGKDVRELRSMCQARFQLRAVAGSATSSWGQMRAALRPPRRLRPSRAAEVERRARSRHTHSSVEPMRSLRSGSWAEYEAACLWRNLCGEVAFAFATKVRNAHQAATMFRELRRQRSDARVHAFVHSATSCFRDSLSALRQSARPDATHRQNAKHATCIRNQLHRARAPTGTRHATPRHTTQRANRGRATCRGTHTDRHTQCVTRTHAQRGRCVVVCVCASRARRAA